MKPVKFSVAVLAQAAMIAAGLTLMPAAQAQTAAPAPDQTATPRDHGEDQARPHNRLESHIAAIKAKLQITDAQAALFDKFAEAVRANENDAQAAMFAARGNRNPAPSIMERLETRVKSLAALRATMTSNDQRFMAAFKPLYDSLTPEQKQAADMPGLIDGALSGR